ncbi:hypothetical protein, partial [Pseudomonas carnis]|uniref:hypothetical protein n=1 Tax=Pseudomonas carnis TaxID=2487355 RepID=UPI001E4D46A8
VTYEVGLGAEVLSECRWCKGGLAFNAGLKADTYLPDTRPSNCGSWLACDGGLTAEAVICVHIHFCGNGHLGFRFYSGSLLEKSPECRPSQK